MINQLCENASDRYDSTPEHPYSLSPLYMYITINLAK